MNYIVFDLEWNQSPGGKERSNPKLPFEIIEIGAVKLNDRFKEIDKFSEVIRPLVYHHLHFRMKEVVPLSENELSNARTFSRVARDFLAWIGKEEFTFVTWGSLDVMELQRNMDYYRIPYEFPKPLLYIDLQKMYSKRYDDGKSRLALEDAIKEMGIDESVPFHRAYDDAFYTAKVMKKMDYKSVRDYVSVDYYKLPASQEEEIYLHFPDYTKYVSREFSDKTQAMQDKNVSAISCPHCKLPTWKRVKWFSTGTGFYLSVIKCPKHGNVKGKIRLKPTENGVFAVKTIKLASEEEAQKIKDRKSQIQEKRRAIRHKKTVGSKN